ncbi:MAG: type II secretion system protein [Clostridium sp.]|uniref:type II secretion system protein n=1 Tax=Clostridium sp. TaxID=1506 RepID=UPI003EE54A90
MKKKDGNSLIEVIVAMSIIIMALGFFGIGVNRFSILTNKKKEKERIENILEIIEKEIKYETSLCEIGEKFRFNNSIFFKGENSFEKEILTSNILDLANHEDGKIELQKEGEIRAGLKLKIIYKERDYEKKFEKEKWMEMQGVYTN